jgi:hypothetical protein
MSRMLPVTAQKPRGLYCRGMREARSIFILGMAILTGAQVASSQLTVKTGRSEKASKPTIIINIPDPIPSDKIEIRYLLSGKFGGYGDYVHPEKNRHAYEIVAALNGIPADGIKVIAYSPGCAFKTYEFRFEDIREAQADFVCDPLPHVTLVGQVVPKSILAGHQAIVRISYLATWDHEFFGIMDGMVQQFELARATSDSDGNFSVDLPDFSVDPRTQQKGHNEAELFLSVVDQKTLNRLADRLVFSDYGTLGGMLQIRSWYPKLTIEAVKGNAAATTK